VKWDGIEALLQGMKCEVGWYRSAESARCTSSATGGDAVSGSGPDGAGSWGSKMNHVPLTIMGWRSYLTLTITAWICS